jgi:hypothetical protein
MPWLRLWHPVANARNGSLLCVSGASTRLRKARVREPICAEPDSRDLGAADPQHGRGVRLDHVHLVPDRRLPRRMPPVTRTARTRGFPEERRAGFEGASVGTTAERFGRRRGLVRVLVGSVKSDIQTIEPFAHLGPHPVTEAMAPSLQAASSANSKSNRRSADALHRGRP